MGDAARLRARVLLRQWWMSAVLLGIVAAAGGGCVLALAMVAKDTSGAVDVYVTQLHAPEGMAVYCPPDAAMAAIDRNDCLRYDQEREAKALRARPEVDAVGRVAATPLMLRIGDEDWTEAFGWVTFDDIAVYGDPPLVAGRLPRADAVNELVVNEAFLSRHRARLGDVAEVAPISWEVFDEGTSPSDDPSPDAIPMSIVGVVRLPSDLTAAVEGNQALSVVEAAMFLGRPWVEAVGPTSFARYQNGVVVNVAPGVDPITVLRSVSPGHVGVSVGESLFAPEIASLDDAVAYEARATTTAAVLAGIAVLVFVGQMLSRQARRELADASTLRAMGATTGLFVRSSVARWVLSAAVAVAGAAVIGSVGRSLGPVGVAQKMLGRSPVGLDPVVATIVLVGLASVVVGVGLGTTALAGRPARSSLGARRVSTTHAPTASALAGLAWATPSGRGRGQATGVVAGLALAVTAAVAATSVVASLQRLTREPVRFGATWDATVTSILGEESRRPVVERLGELDGVQSVAAIIGETAVVGDDEVYVYGLAPVPGLPDGIQPEVTRGRAPAAADEIALGSTTLDRAGADIGDTVRLTYLEQERTLRVVGEVLVYDTWERIPGVGAVIDDDLLLELEPGGETSDYAVRFTPGHAAAGLRELEEAFPDQVTGPVVPGSVRNLQRVSAWPALLSMFVGLLALAALVHALVTTVRRQRGDLAVLRALGFRRRQLGTTVSWYSSALVAPALVIGLPLGIVIGRWGWRVLAGNLGVPPVPVVPIAGLVAIGVVTFVLANLVAGPLAYRAGHVDSVESLRAE
jgi:ABC-type lipoprotein release transport system permease subunit